MAERMMDIKTLTGISEAREVLFNRLINGEMPEVRAREAERMLRGQQTLKADVPLKFMKLVMGRKNFEPFTAELAQGISEFINGRPALPSGS